ncbi:MAG: polyphosphate kinase [Bacteroidia bacterium]|nr:MAG: polyphosphate kinase [Bacteroidia bacterium]
MKKNFTPHINREISWLSFNERVLQEAEDKRNPLLERLKFLGIFSNNRDEFYRVRVATVKRLMKLGHRAIEIYGEDPEVLLKQLQNKVLAQQQKFDELYLQILEELKENNIFIVNEREVLEEHKEYISNFFHNEVMPSLFPILIDARRPFPFLKDKYGYLYIKLRSIFAPNQNKFALIEIPTKVLSRFVILPPVKSKKYIILLDDVIRLNINEIFNVFGLECVGAYNIKLTRDAELEIDNDLSESILEKVSKGLKDRQKGKPVRFVYDKDMPQDMLQFVMRKLGMTNTKDSVIPGGRYHNFKDFINFPDLGLKHLTFQNPPPINIPELDELNTPIIDYVLKKDILFHFPYHSYNYLIKILQEASIDPRVQSIQITLYRLAESSRIANALINAVKNGKKVTVVVELQARFDEEHNIYWAEKLKEEGAEVIYGVPGLKVHSKLFLIEGKIKNQSFRIAHIGTGNFNEKTARVYTDLSLITAHKGICKDVGTIFNFYRNNLKIGEYKHLIVSPFNMRSEFIKYIHKEIKNVKRGLKGEIILKLNNLVDKEMISHLYKASQEGVQVFLIVRSACSLVTELPNYSDNIRAYSIVDKYLEHARIFIFHNGGNEKVFISSADWMTRNLDHRSEVATPIYDEHIKKIIKDLINIQLSGNQKVRIIDRHQTNKYKLPAPGEEIIRVQDKTYEYLKELPYKKTAKINLV